MRSILYSNRFTPPPPRRWSVSGLIRRAARRSSNRPRPKSLALPLKRPGLKAAWLFWIKIGEDVVKTFDANAWWAEDRYPFGTYSALPHGE